MDSAEIQADTSAVCLAIVLKLLPHCLKPGYGIGMRLVHGNTRLHSQCKVACHVAMYDLVIQGVFEHGDCN
jgi:hypothetical protein